jgi:hypothetical protein
MALRHLQRVPASLPPSFIGKKRGAIASSTMPLWGSKKKDEGKPSTPPASESGTFQAANIGRNPTPTSSESDMFGGLAVQPKARRKRGQVAAEGAPVEAQAA